MVRPPDHHDRAAWRWTTRRAAAAAAVLAAVVAVVAGCTRVTPIDIFGVPKNLIDRAIEARNGHDIVRDNEIVIAANGAMLELVVLNVAIDIYEQRVLVTGLLEDRDLADRLRTRLAAIPGVRAFYWHVVVMTAEERKQRRESLYDWGQMFWLDTAAGVRLFGTAGVADVNFRVGTDAFGTVYILGRARSQAEHDAALDAVRTTEGARGAVSYVEVRP